jgi:cell division protein FtsZ
MPISISAPDITELKPRLMVFGCGGAGGNAVNNMISAGLQGVEFVVANTDAQALQASRANRVVQMGVAVTEGLGAGSHPEVGRAAAEESLDEIRDHLSGFHMAFITAGMGGGTGTGAAPVVARAAKEMGILTVGVVTKPFQFEGVRRMKTADAGIIELQKHVDTLIVIPNQNLFRVANEKTTFADAFAMADQVLYSGVACITDLMVKEGLINLDFADVRSVMREMGKAMMGTGEASGEKRANRAAEAAISNPLLDDVSMRGARGLLISITGGRDMTLYELDEAATRIREEVDQDANIIVGATYDDALEGIIRVSVVATGIDAVPGEAAQPAPRAVETPKPRTVPAPMAAAAPRVAQPTSVPVTAAEPTTLVAPPQAIAQPTAPMAPAPQPAAATLQPEPAPVPVRQDPAVTIRPIAPPAPSLFVEPAPQPKIEAEVAPQPAAFIPPAPERPDTRVPRMPRVEELPPVAQRQIQAAREPQPAQAHPVEEKRGMLQRLAALGGLGRKREDEAAAPAATIAPAPQPRPAAPPIAEAYRPQAPAAQPRQQVPSGQRPVPAQSEEDQLEIPAFLRRTGNG